VKELLSKLSLTKGQQMKLTLILAAGILLAGAVNAQSSSGGFSGNAAPARGGFTGPVTVLTVEEAKNLNDDTKVTLRGTIERHIGGEDYLFRDASGTVQVEIDSDRWAGQNVAPQDQIEIFGEVDKNWNSVEIDVKRLQKR
jgi:uncharacterized protein (TIGR00156 family)